MIDAVLCELEGVVVETAVPRRRAMMHAFAEAGLDASGIEDVTGLPVREAVVVALGEGSAARDATLIDLLAAKANRHFLAEVATGLTLARGAVEALSLLQARARLAIVTRAERDVVDSILPMAGMEGLFEVIVSAGDVIEAKPHPEGYRAALGRLTNRRRVAGPLALEDALPGVRAARAAGVPSIVIGATPAHEAIEADAMTAGLAGHTLDSLGLLVTRGGARVG